MAPRLPLRLLAAAALAGAAGADHGRYRGLKEDSALFVELGGRVALPTARFCKVCTVGGGCEVVTPGRPVMATGYAVYATTVPLNSTHSLYELPPPVDAAGIVGLFGSADERCQVSRLCGARAAAPFWLDRP